MPFSGFTLNNGQCFAAKSRLSGENWPTGFCSPLLILRGSGISCLVGNWGDQAGPAPRAIVSRTRS